MKPNDVVRVESLRFGTRSVRYGLVVREVIGMVEVEYSREEASGGITIQREYAPTRDCRVVGSVPDA